jgi:hypothetical protein
MTAAKIAEREADHNMLFSRQTKVFASCHLTKWPKYLL